MPDEPADRGTGAETAGADYAERLQRLQGARWKQLLDVQRPYRWNLQRLELGRVLDVGCGIGRMLRAFGPDSVGVDHNADAIALARQQGYTAYTTQEFLSDPSLAVPESFDSILMAHLLEHLDAGMAEQIVRDYLPLVRPGGRLVAITPQEVGYRSDATHVRFVGFEEVRQITDRLGLTVEKTYSFPFPRPVGKAFIYNEFVTVARVGHGGR